MAGTRREFDRNDALEKALLVFWRRGYEATSLDDLLEAMNIGRQSLYDTFGDKHSLFLEALERYVARRTEEIVSALDAAPSVRQGMDAIFMAVARESATKKRRGCFGVNTVMELAPHDAKVAKVLAAEQRHTTEHFYRALERGRQRGELSGATDAKDLWALARFLVGALQGMRVSAKADPTSPAPGDIARMALKAIE